MVTMVKYYWVNIKFVSIFLSSVYKSPYSFSKHELNSIRSYLIKQFTIMSSWKTFICFLEERKTFKFLH